MNSQTGSGSAGAPRNSGGGAIAWLSLDWDTMSIEQDSRWLENSGFRAKEVPRRAPLLQHRAAVTIPILDAQKTTRREFCTHACEALSLAALGAIVQGCGGSPTSPSGSAPALPTATATLVANTLVVTIDAASPLTSIGSAAIVQSPSGQFLVAHTAAETFVVVTAICTHEGCTITGYTNQVYVCPCHGSRFNTNGAVVSGPASTSLRRFTTQFAGSTLTIVL